MPKRFRFALAVVLLGTLCVGFGPPSRSVSVAAPRRSAGIELTFRAVPGLGRSDVTRNDLQRTATILRERFAKLGATSTVSVDRSSKLVIVKVYGEKYLAPRVTAPLFQPAQIRLFDFEKDLMRSSVDARGNPIARTSLYSLLKPLQRTPAASSEGFYLFRTTGHKLIADARTRGDLLRPFGGKPPSHSEVLRVPAHVFVLRCAAATGCLGARSSAIGGSDYYLMQFYPANRAAIPELMGDDLVSSATRAAYGASGGPVLLLRLTKHGSAAFLKITRDEAQRGRRRYTIAGRVGDYHNYVQHFAIALDGQLESTPFIDFKQNPGGLSTTGAEIDLGFGSSIQAARHLALVLQTGALPVTLVQVSRRSISR